MMLEPDDEKVIRKARQLLEKRAFMKLRLVKLSTRNKHKTARVTTTRRYERRHSQNAVEQERAQSLKREEAKSRNHKTCSLLYS